MLSRTLAVAFRREVLLREPVLLQGPRGAGKTALARTEFPDYAYISMEDAGARRQAMFSRGPAILDDMHCAPELVERLRGRPVILLSSRKLETPFPTFTLYPPTRAELEQRPPLTLGRPGPAAAPFPEGRSFLHYDIRELVNVRELARFERFLEQLRARSGRVLDQQELARAAGVAHRTVVRWMDALRQCFRILLLSPYGESFGRRVTRAPKMHWLGSDHFESRAVWEMYRNAVHAGQSADARYWRDSNGLEIPLILDGLPVAIAEEPNPLHETRLRRWMAMADATSGAIVGQQPGPSRRGIVRYSIRQL